MFRSPHACWSRWPVLLLVIFLASVLATCSGVPKPTYFPGYPVGFVERGVASWYGPGFHGNKTANGERYDMHQLTAAHRTLPLGSIAVVRSMSTGRQVTVRINDRGPFARGRVLDLSLAGAQALEMTGSGTDEIELQVVGYQGSLPMWGLYECKSDPFPISRMRSTSWTAQSLSIQSVESRLSICRKASDIEFRSVSFPGKPRQKPLLPISNPYLDFKLLYFGTTHNK